MIYFYLSESIFEIINDAHNQANFDIYYIYTEYSIYVYYIRVRIYILDSSLIFHPVSVRITNANGNN